MSPAQGFQQRLTEIHDLVANDQIEAAIKRSWDFVVDYDTNRESHREMLLIRRDYSMLEKAQRTQLRTFEESRRDFTRMLDQLLQLLDAVCESQRRAA